MRGRGVEHLTGASVDYIILDAPVFSRRIAAVQALGDKLEGGAVVEQLTRIVRIGLRYRFALPQPLGLVQRQPGAFDVGGVMRLQNQRLFAHLTHSVSRELRRLEKAPRPLDADDCLRHAVGDGELWSKSHGMFPLIQRPDNQSGPAATDFPGHIQHFCEPESLQQSGQPSKLVWPHRLKYTSACLGPWPS